MRKPPNRYRTRSTADRADTLRGRARTGPNVVVLSDYAKGVLCDAVLAAVLARAEASDCLVIADPKRPGLRGLSWRHHPDAERA